MWKLIAALLFNSVLFTLQSVEQPTRKENLQDEEFLTGLRAFLTDEEKADSINPRFNVYKTRKTDGKVEGKTPFMFTSPYKKYLLVSTQDTVKFNCSTNDPHATYKLIHEITMPPYVKKIMSPDGVKFLQNGAIFSLKKLSLKDGGKYYCIAENQQGEQIRQQPLTLFVTNQIVPNVTPRINPRVKYAEFGDDVTFTCYAYGLGYSLKWEVKNENDVFVEVPATLVAERPSRMDRGYIKQAISLNLEDVRPPPYNKTYRCCLDFQGDLRYSYALLDIKAPEMPFINQLPSYIGITEGSDFEFKCRASGSPPPVIMWSKDGEILSNCELDGSCYLKGKNYIISGEHNEVMRIENADISKNSGNIVCHALNVAGMDEEVTLIRVYDEGYIPSNHEKLK